MGFLHTVNNTFAKAVKFLKNARCKIDVILVAVSGLTPGAEISYNHSRDTPTRTCVGNSDFLAAQAPSLPFTSTYTRLLTVSP